MKTLILHGSPRKKGDTAALLQILTAELDGEFRIVDTYRADIAPCLDCRFCRSHAGCAIDDDMTALYRYIEDCDNIVLASPMYFNELTGRMLDICSRLQMYFSAAHFRHAPIPIRPKRGGVILTGGGMGNPEKPYDTAVNLLHHMGAKEIFPLVCSFGTDAVPAAMDDDAAAAVRQLAAFLNDR